MTLDEFRDFVIDNIDDFYESTDNDDYTLEWWFDEFKYYCSNQMFGEEEDE